MKACVYALLFGLVAVPAWAGSTPTCGKESPTGVHGRHAHGRKTVYDAAMARMHRDMQIRYTGDVDTDFARGMVPHHQGAIDMADLVLKRGKDQEIRELATRIIAAQKQEIAEMKHWIHTRGRDRIVYPSASEAAFAEVMKKMHHGMHQPSSGTVDADFVRGMIPHHQGAIDMADIVRAEGDDPFLLALAEDIIRSQGQEIAQMEAWLEQSTAATRSSR